MANKQITELAGDFSANHQFSYVFGRAAGVAVGADQRLYVTDFDRSQMVILDASRNFERRFPYGNDPTGIAFAADGKFLGTSFFDGTVRQIDVATSSSTVVVNLLENPVDVAFASDGTYYLATTRGSVLQHRSSSHALIESVATSRFMDSVVVMPGTSVPEAGSMCGLALSVLLFGNRRRMRYSHNNAPR